MGEVWLHEAIATSYLPVLDVLARLAEKGHRNLATVGITPVLAAQLDDPECLQATRSWAADWLWRTQELGQYDRPAAAREAQQANATLHA
ncbi:MAG: 1,4-alpha-glucan branching protein, partial [Candidatus Nanopelagicales bacterium]